MRNYKKNESNLNCDEDIVDLINSEKREWNQLIADTDEGLITERSDNNNGNAVNNSIQSLNSKFLHNYSIDSSISNKNSLVQSLKESIKRNVKTIKKNKQNNSTLNEDEKLMQSMSKAKIKTEKDKLIEYYQNLKSNSKLNLSLESSLLKENAYGIDTDKRPELINTQNEKKWIQQTNYNPHNYYNTPYRVNPVQQSSNYSIQDENLQVSSKDNEFVIFDCFKNMLNKKKSSRKSMSGGMKLYPNINPINGEERDILFYSQNNVNPSKGHAYNFAGSLIKDLDDMETSRFNNNQIAHNFEGEEMQNMHNMSAEEISVHINNDQENLKLENKTKSQCSNTHCLFFRKKFRTFKNSSKEYRKKYIKMKKINELLNMKIFYYENNKSSSQILNTQTEKLNSTNMSTSKDDEVKLTKMVFDKLQENYALFEKLENEIISKEAIIEKQNETIRHQKQTIDGLLEHFNIFLAQGNYLINDLLMLKQNIYDKNLKEVTKECEEISTTINDYTKKIKDFSDKTKGIIDEELIPDEGIVKNLEQEEEKASIDDVKNKDNRLLTIEEISSNFEQNESNLSFSLSKSNTGIRNNINLSSTNTNMDRSLKLMDLSQNTTNNQQNVNNMFNLSQSDSITGNLNFNFHKEDKEIEDLFD